MARNVGNLAERGEDPNTQLLLISHEIRETESDLNIARGLSETLQRKLSRIPI